MSDEPTYYVVTINMPGYLPESEPTIIIDDRPPTHVLEYIQDEVKRAAPERDAEGQPDEWDLLIDELERDRERAAEFDLSGFLYAMPDGYAIEATRYSREQLIELGYTPNEDF